MDEHPAIPSNGDATKADAYYEVWANEGKQSNTATARLLGCSEANIRQMRRRHNWDARYYEALLPDSETLAALTVVGLRSLYPQMVERLGIIVGGKKTLRDGMGRPVIEDGKPVQVWEAEHKDAVAASKLLLQFGLSGHPPGHGLPHTDGATPIPTPEQTRDLDAGRLRQAATAILEANYQQVNTRRKKGQRT